MNMKFEKRIKLNRKRVDTDFLCACLVLMPILLASRTVNVIKFRSKKARDNSQKTALKVQRKQLTLRSLVSERAIETNSIVR